MAAVYLDSILIEYYSGSAWVDITAYVVGDIKGNNGLGGWKPDQRVAALGTLNITLNNKSKKFSPMGGDTVRGLSTLAGFNKGAKIRVRGVYYGIYYTIWTGRISNIDSDDLNWGNEQARLMAVDWMQVPVNYPMQSATIALNQRIDQAMTLILARLSVQPESTSYDTGSNIFPAVFDNVQRKTMALSEFTKLANSELSYIYVKQDGTLKVESMLSRQGWRALDQVWIVSDTNNYLLKEDGFFLLKEDGGKLLLDEGALANAAIATDAEGYNILLAEDGLLNASIIRAYPVETDTNLQILYFLGTPVLIPTAKTITFSGHYVEYYSKSQVSGTNMQVPVSASDYKANTAIDFSGTDKTADVVVVATYYGDQVFYSVTNNATVGVYFTIEARGYRISYGDSIESTINDATSQAAYGYAPFQFDMKYQKDTYLAKMYGLSVIEEYKNPKSRITKMKYLANLNKNHMMSFLVLTIGSLILGTEDRSAISNHYYITDRAFTIQQGGIINVEYGVKQNDSYLSGGLNPVTVEFSGNTGASADALEFGYLPQASNDAAISKRSFSVWVYLTTVPAGGTACVLFDVSPEGSQPQIYLQQATPTESLIVFSSTFSTTGGLWYTNDEFGLNAWHLITITYDSSSAANDPVFYIDGVVSTSGETSTPVGTKKSEAGSTLRLGTWKDYTSSFKGKMFDPRIYNRILTQAEVTTLYNAGTPLSTLVTSGLVFQGFSTYADTPLAAGHVLTSTDRLIENIVRAVGIPHGAPVIRANP
jgi:hypothetical protein